MRCDQQMNKKICRHVEWQDFLFCLCAHGDKRTSLQAELSNVSSLQTVRHALFSDIHAVANGEGLKFSRFGFQRKRLTQMEKAVEVAKGMSDLGDDPLKFLVIPVSHWPIGQHPSMATPGSVHQPQLVLIESVDELGVVCIWVAATESVWACVWSDRMVRSASTSQLVRLPARHLVGFPIVASSCARLRVARLIVNHLDDGTLMLSALHDVDCLVGDTFLRAYTQHSEQFVMAF